MKRNLNRLMGIMLTLVLMLAMSLTAYADSTIYNPASTYDGFAALASGDDTVSIEGVQYNNTTVDWYVIGYDSTAKTVTLLSKQPFGNSKFNNSKNDGNNYDGSVVKSYVEGLTGAGKPLAGIKDVLADVNVTDPIVTGKVPYLLNISEASNNLTETKRKGVGSGYWWLRSPGGLASLAAYVYGDYGNVIPFGGDVTDSRGLSFGVRPALKLNLSSVIFSSKSNKFSLPVAVTGVSLNPSAAQTITVGGSVAFTATVTPDNASDNTVKWSVGGTNASAVTLYEDADCTKAVGTDPTDALIVYAKGMSAGDAKVSVTTTDGSWTASCDVTVNPVTYTVTYKVVNGTWSDGTTADITETVASGSKPASVPTGMKASEGYTGGAWDTNPADATITEAKTFTYTFTAKQAATVTKAPTAKNLTYNGSAQELVTAGEATGGTMQYALGTATEATEQYTTSIPAKTDAGTYYVWYYVKGDANHTDTEPDCIEVLINPYSYISGDGGTWTKSSGLPQTFQIENTEDDSKTFSNFAGAKVDGKQLMNDKEYTASRGSVIIELKPTFLETLSVGEHTIQAEFTDGKADAKFTVAASTVNLGSLPQTGDNSNLFVHLFVGLLAIAGLGLTIKKQ